METTRHFVATVYVVCDGATCLHEHPKLDMWLPPGGHIDRDELPHEAAVREVREETGLDVDLLASRADIDTGDTVQSLPQSQQFLLEDINVHPDGCVGHQHIDFVFYGRADSRDITPGGSDEVKSDSWEWFAPADLREHADRLEPDVVDIGQRAIEAVEEVK